MRASLYARVSSSAQRDRHTIESQLRALPAYAAAQGWAVVATHVDDGRTARAGHLADRPGFAALLADVAARRCDVVVVVDLDRLTRAEDMTERGAVLGAFQRSGVLVAVSSTGQLLDLRTSHGDLLGVLGSYFAAEENRKRRERTIAGKLTAIGRGGKPAGPTPYGYRYDRATRSWSVDADEAAVVLDVYQRAAAGETADAIAAGLRDAGAPPPTRRGGWSVAAVYRLLRQGAYRGTWTADKARQLVVAVPELVPAELWHAVASRPAAAARRRRGLRRTRGVYLLEGLAVCSVCGEPVRIASARAATPWLPEPTPARYVCRSRLARDGAAPCTPRGQHRQPRTAEVDARAWAVVAAELGTEDLAARLLARDLADAADGQAWQADLAAAERQLDRLARHEATVLARARRGLVTEAGLDAELAALARERQAATRQAETARRAAAQAAAARTGHEALTATLTALRDAVATATPEERRELLRVLVRPGEAVLSPDGAVELVVGVPAPAPISLAVGAGCSRGGDADTGNRVLLRLVVK